MPEPFWMPTLPNAIAVATEAARMTGYVHKVRRGRKIAGWFIDQTPKRVRA